MESNASNVTSSILACPTDSGFLTALIAAQATISSVDPGDRDLVIRTILDQSQQLCGGDGAIYDVVDSGEFRAVAAVGLLEEHVGLIVPRSGSLSGLAAAQRSPLICDDAERDARVNREACQRLGVRSFIVVPLIYGPNVTGLLRVASARPNAFDALHVFGMQMIGNTLAAKLAHADTFAAHRQLLAERSAALDALCVSEKRFRLLADYAPVAIFETDTDGAVTFMNERWTEISGTPVGETLGVGWSIALHPDDRERVLATWYADSQAGREYNCEYRLCTRDGRITWIHARAVAIRDEAGAVVGHIGTASDITDRKRREWQEVDRGEVLEMLTRGEGLSGILQRLAAGLDRQMDNARAAVLIGDLQKDELTLVRSAVPEAFANALRPLLGQVIRSLETSSAGSGVCTIDLTTHPDYRGLRVAAAVHRVNTLWLREIRSADGHSLGVLVQCAADARGPSPVEAQAIVAASRMASVVVDSRRAAERIAHAATHDVLTGLPNRATFHDRLNRAIATARRVPYAVGVLTFDIDKFKHVNDTLGHASGDAVLIEFARRMAGVLRDSDTFARVGGDEFMAILPACNDVESLAIVAGKMAAALATPIALPSGLTYRATTSIGGALVPERGGSVAEVLEAADRSLYAVKQRGRDGFEIAPLSEMAA